MVAVHRSAGLGSAARAGILKDVGNAISLLSVKNWTS